MPFLTSQRAVTHPCAGVTGLSWSVCVYQALKSFLKSSSSIAVPSKGLMLLEAFQMLTRLNLGSTERDRVTLKWTKVQQFSSFWTSTRWPACFSWILFKPHKCAHSWKARKESVFQSPWCVLPFPHVSCGIGFFLPFQCAWFCPWWQLGRECESKRSRLETQTCTLSRTEGRRGGAGLTALSSHTNENIEMGKMEGEWFF